MVDELDIYTLIQSFQNSSEDDEVFVEAFSYDLCLLGEALEKKRLSLGIKDYAAFSKIQAIQRNLKSNGATLAADLVK